MHHTKTSGDIAELIVAAKFIKLGYTVCRPLSEHARYDLLIDDGKEILKVQVKARSMKNGSISIPKYTSNKVYEKGDFDLIAAYCIDTQEIAVLKFDDLLDTTVLRVVPTKNNQTKNIRLFETYKI